MDIMFRYRNRPWFPLLSVAILTVFIQAQASGCCKIGAWFHAAANPASGSIAVAASGTPVSPSATERSCCPKPAPGEGAVAAPDAASAARVFAGSMERACCIQDADLNTAEIVSLHDGSSAPVAIPIFQRVLGILSTPRSEAFAASAFPDSGPPASRSALPLLI